MIIICYRAIIMDYNVSLCCFFTITHMVHKILASLSSLHVCSEHIHLEWLCTTTACSWLEHQLVRIFH